MSGTSAVSTATFDREVLQSNGLVLVDFWAPWCRPCLVMAPTLDQLAQDYAGKVKVLKLNTDENQEIAERYGIRGIPTLILFKGGKPIDGVVGVQPKDVLAAKLDKALAH
jgi:thioredoxin 1